VTTEEVGERQTRERLVTAATGLFRRQGVARTGIAEICERAGVTKGVFSHHFPGGKNDLVVEVVGRNARDVERGLASLGPAQGRPLDVLVEQLFAGYTAFLEDKGTDFGCPVAASIVDLSAASPSVRAAAEAAFDAWRASLRRFEQMPDPASGVDALILAALQGGILMARAANDPSVLDQVGRVLGKLLRHATDENDRDGLGP
jgi:AcrR family transcriptional regulator